MTLKKIITILLVTVLSVGAKAQNDTVTANVFIDKNIKTKQTREVKPGRAALYSAVLPGAGQAYNKSYWKIPVVYTFIGGVVFLADYNNKKYKNYLNSYVALTDTLETTVSQYGDRYSAAELLTNKDNARRNRDLSYILLFAVYGLNIIEANVDAHFANFDVDEDLSFKISPAIINSHKGTLVPGLCFAIQF